jgi:ADP-ribose pyrophosphatase YjhB (NUDIX family)
MTSADDPQWRPARFCSRCGAPLGQRTVGGRLRAACAACGFVAYADPKVACAVIVEENGRVLLVRRRHEPGRGLWCLPAGFADADEPPDQAARREAREEAGVEVVVGELLGAYHYTDDPRGAGILLVYRARRADTSPLAAGDDADDVGFFDLGALPPISHHTHREALDEWQRLG